MSNVRCFFEVTKAALCLVILIGWGFSLLNISATFINEEVYLGTVVLIAPLALKGARCLWRMNEYILRCKKKYGENCRPSLFQTYMTAGQMLIYMKSLMDLGNPVEVKSIRWEADFLMGDFRKRIYLMFFPAIEAAYYVCFVPWYFKHPIIYIEEPLSQG